MSSSSVAPLKLHGLLAEFSTPDAVVGAARSLREAGYTKVEGYSPYPMEALIEALHIPRSIVPRLVLLGAMVGGLGGYALQYWSQVIDYPLNIGGRPAHSWPSFIIPTFETTILLAALSAVVGMILLNGLPRPYHPLFNVERFSRASQDRFFLMVEAADPRFDREKTRSFLEGLDSESVSEVED
jgi:hypothetical protein